MGGCRSGPPKSVAEANGIALRRSPTGRRSRPTASCPECPARRWRTRAMRRGRRAPSARSPCSRGLGHVERQGADAARRRRLRDHPGRPPPVASVRGTLVAEGQLPLAGGEAQAAEPGVAPSSMVARLADQLALRRRRRRMSASLRGVDPGERPRHRRSPTAPSRSTGGVRHAVRRTWRWAGPDRPAGAAVGRGGDERAARRRCRWRPEHEQADDDAVAGRVDAGERGPATRSSRRERRRLLGADGAVRGDHDASARAVVRRCRTRRRPSRRRDRVARRGAAPAASCRQDDQLR